VLIENHIRLSRSDVGKDELVQLEKVVNEGYLGIGEFVKEFEKRIKNFLQTDKEVICVNSGTAALHLALQAAGITSGDEVLVPSITYVATYQAISATGAIPISCDVLRKNMFLDCVDAKKRLTTRTKAIVPVHYGGSSIGVQNIYNFANANGLRVIEDAAHSFGSERDQKKVGADGDILCFSFDGIKNITCGEGGAILSGDKKIIERVKDSRLLGVSKDSDQRYKGKRSWMFDVKSQGWRYHMSNINAAIGMAQLDNCIQKFRHKKLLADKYIKALENIDEIELLDIFSKNTVNHIFPILVKNDIRDKLREFLASEKIETGIHYQPNHKLSLYKSNYSLPVSEDLSRRVISLPFHSLLTLDEQKYVLQKIKNFFAIYN